MVIQDAWHEAQRVLDDEIRPLHGDDVVVSAVIDHPKAWAFVYNSRRFLEDGDFLASIVGNGPVVVPKSGAPSYLASAAEPVGDQLDRL